MRWHRLVEHASEQWQVLWLMHCCGSRTVQMRNFIMGNPHAQRQRLFPQCSECSGKQGAFVGSGKGNPLVMHWRLWRVTPPGFLPGIFCMHLQFLHACPAINQLAFY